MNVDDKLYKVRIGYDACGSGCCFDHIDGNPMTYEEAVNLAKALHDDNADEGEICVDIIFIPSDENVRWAIPFAPVGV